MKVARPYEVDYDNVLPENASQGTWIGRCWVPSDLAYKEIEGPHVIWVSNGVVYDISNHFLTASQLLNQANPVQDLRSIKNLKRLTDFSSLIKKVGLALAKYAGIIICKV